MSVVASLIPPHLMPPAPLIGLRLHVIVSFCSFTVKQRPSERWDWLKWKRFHEFFMHYIPEVDPQPNNKAEQQCYTQRRRKRIQANNLGCACRAHEPTHIPQVNHLRTVSSLSSSFLQLPSTLLGSSNNRVMESRHDLARDQMRFRKFLAWI